MRPEILFPLFAPVTSLPGVGKGLGKAFDRLGMRSVADLLWHLPTGWVDRHAISRADAAEPGTVVTLLLTVEQHLPGEGPRRPYRIRCSDGSGAVTLVWFNPRGDYLADLLPPGETRAVSGRLDSYNGELQITHPDHVVAPDALERISGIEPVYALTQGLTAKQLSRVMQAAVARAPALPEWHQPPRLAGGWPGWLAAIEAAHHPAGAADLEPAAPARRRLAYDELLANQLALGLIRQHQRRLGGTPRAGDGRLRTAVEAVLPYRLTGAQVAALAEIAADMATPRRMLRLLQGDVGSGKTVVALMAMLIAVETGAQAALMAPTELLARQHLATIEPLAAAAGVRLAALTGRDKGRARVALLDDLAAGRIDIVVGTHALLQDDVAFRDLGLAVIDEQHRFGVHQRLSLTAKGHGTDVLVMTATPIPRTLMLTAYGDLDSSRLTEKPAGRQPVATVVVPADRLDEVAAGIGRQIAAGAKAYWVCPLVEESEQADRTAAIERHRALAERLGNRVGLVHGRMKAAEKDAVMAAFAGDGLDVLVATTVIEVGVNVPSATVMVVEHAERFGLAQLHQLRGRVGRGSARASCVLVYQPPLGETAKARLAMLKATEDGFAIAEEDLRLRGAGELLGTRQSGMPEFRLADLAAHQDLLTEARDEAAAILDADPGLDGPRGPALRVLLYLFERDAAVRYLRSG